MYKHTRSRSRGNERRREWGKGWMKIFGVVLVSFFGSTETKKGAKKSKEREEDGGVKYLFVVIYLNIKHTDNQATR